MSIYAAHFSASWEALHSITSYVVPMNAQEAHSE